LRWREFLELACASFVALLVGLSLYVDMRGVFDLGVLDTLLLVLLAYLLHELSHKARARRLAGGGEFNMSITGSFYSLLIAGILNAWGILGQSVVSLMGLELAKPYRIVPFRFLTLGTVVLRERRGKKVVGKVASSGPLANLALGWLMFSLPFLGLLDLDPELLLVGSALNAYTALTSLLPLAFCDGLSIYWWSRKAWLALLVPTIILMIMSNFFLLSQLA